MPSPFPDGFNDRQFNLPGYILIDTISPTTFKDSNFPDLSIGQHLDVEQDRSSSKLLASSSASPGIWRRLVYMSLQLPGFCLNPNPRKSGGSRLNIGRLPYPCNSRNLLGRFFKDFPGWLLDGLLDLLDGRRSHLHRHLNRRPDCLDRFLDHLLHLASADHFVHRHNIEAALVKNRRQLRFFRDIA